jgi:hypothetical protein
MIDVILILCSLRHPCCENRSAATGCADNEVTIAVQTII